MRRLSRQAWLFAAAGFAISARAQVQPPPPAEGPVLVGVRHESWSAFELERVQASLEFLGQYQTDRQRTAAGTTLKNRESLFRETLDLEGEASIGHKNLLDLTGAIQLGLEDRFTDSQSVGFQGHESDLVGLYDIRGLFLGNGPAPTTLYTRREQDFLNQAFAGTIEQTTQESGVITQIQSERAPTTLHYFHRTQELKDQFGQLTSSTAQDTFNLQSGIRITDGQRLDIAYTFDHIDEQQPGFGGDTYDRQDANIVHTLDFGGESRPHELRSGLRIYDQGGRFSQSETRLDELLILHHSDRLETRYNLSVDQQTRGDEDQRLYRGEASIRHHLFESLTSTASLGGQRLEAPDSFSSDELFGTVALDYIKTVPMGRIDASGGASYDTQHNSARGGTLSVLNESHTFNDPFPIALSRRNIIAGSIVVTPPSGFPPYREGIDYTVRAFPDRAELTVPPGSAIADGQTVLVSYDIGPEPGSEIDTTGFSFTFRYSLTEGALEGLSAYTTYRTLDHTLDTANPTLFVLDDTRDLLLGVEYQRAGLDAKLERETHDSSVNPSNTNRLQVLYQQLLGRDSFVNVEVTHESIAYTLQDNRVDFDRLTGRWNQRLTPAFDFNVRLEYRSERDDLNGSSQGFDQIVGFTWHRAQTTIYGSARNSLLNGPGSDTISQFFQLGVRRRF